MYKKILLTVVFTFTSLSLFAAPEKPPSPFWTKQWGFTPDKIVTFSWGRAIDFYSQKTPPLPANQISSQDVKNLLSAGFSYNFLKTPLFLKWGLKARAGFSLNPDPKSSYLAPLSLTGIVHFQAFKPIIPFLSAGVSQWLINFKSLSERSFHLSLGARISLSLFKPSLQYTLLDDYGLNDMGITLESLWRFYKNSQFMHSFHAGFYLKI